MGVVLEVPLELRLAGGLEREVAVVIIVPVMSRHLAVC